MSDRRLATHGMAYGALALEACAIVGGVFMTLSAVFALFASSVGVALNGWTVVAVPLLVSAGALFVVWRLGFASIDSARAQTVVPSVIIITTINSLFMPMILGVILVPAGGVSLLWTVFGVLWAVVALAAVVDAVHDWVVNDPTSMPLDIMTIVATFSAIASAGVMLASGMTGLLFGIVFLGGLLGMSVGLGFLTAEEPVESEKTLEGDSQTAPAHGGRLAHG